MNNISDSVEWFSEYSVKSRCYFVTLITCLYLSYKISNQELNELLRTGEIKSLGFSLRGLRRYE